MAVVAAAEEYAYQGLIAGAACGERVHLAEAGEHVHCAKCGDGPQRVAHEFSSGTNQHGFLLLSELSVPDVVVVGGENQVAGLSGPGAGRHRYLRRRR